MSTSSTSRAAAGTSARDDAANAPPNSSRLEPCSYVSSLLAGRLAGGRPLADAESLPLFGALMLTDIEGWTSRVEQLSEIGPWWLDELGRAVNAYFIELARVVYAHDGDILTGTGDAFLCCWPASGVDGVPAACARAARAAVAFQEAASRHVDPNGRRLRTRIGVSAGALQAAIVGGVNGRWELLPLGTPMEEVRLAESRAPAGGVAVAASAWRHLASTAGGVPLGDAGMVVLTTAPPGIQRISRSQRKIRLAEDVLAPYVPAPVRGWDAPTGSEWLAELRHVTAVMARVAGKEGPLGEDLELTQTAVRSFQQTIARFEGASKPGVDSKGLTLSGVFGLPPRAHADDRERALRAATAVGEQLERAGLECCIGIASGPIFCALFGSDLRREYTISGNAMNLAARLAHSGDGGIFCDEQSSSGLDDRFLFERLAPLALKGRQSPTPVLALKEVAARRRLRATELVGREEERARLARVLERLPSSAEGEVVVIEGEAGIGKSALAAHAAQLAEHLGVDVIVAVADAVERTTGYYAWRQAFTEILGADAGAVDVDELERRVVAHAGADADVLREVPLLSSVLPVEIADNDFTKGLSGDLRADTTIRLLTRILTCVAASRPLLVIVEDAQWLDTNSWSLLRSLAREVPRTLTLLTTRPLAVDSPEHAALASLTSAEPLRLASLTPAGTAELVRRRLGVERNPPGLASFIEERVAGHPYFCEALVKSMLEGGIVRVRSGRAVVDDLGALDVPITVQGAVLSLIDRLTARQQLTLKVATVVGRTFSVRAVADAHPMEEERSFVGEDLRALVDLDLIGPDDSEPEPAYTFRHQITRDIAYGLLTPTQRLLLHRSVAEAHERASSGVELDRIAALLAHHWKCAEELPRAVPYLEKASTRALRGGAFREAAHLYGQLAATADAMPVDARQLALWEKGEASANYYLGDFERARPRLERALASLHRPVPNGTLALARGLLRAAAAQLAHLLRPRRYRERRSGERQLLVQAVDAYKLLALINYVGGESAAELLYLFIAALNLGEEAGASPELAAALAGAAGAVSLCNLRRLADRYAERARHLCEHEGHSEALAWIWNVQAVIEAQRGDWKLALQASDNALELFGEVGDYNYEAEIWQTRAGIHICRGDFTAAERCWRRTRELAARNANAQLHGWSLLDEVQTQLGRGAIDDARGALEAALAIEDAPHDEHTEIEKHYCIAATRLAEGAREDALPAAERVLDVCTSRPLSGFWLADFAAGAAEVHVALLEQASSRAERAALARAARHDCRALRRAAWTFHGIRPRRAVLLGRVEWERGRRRRAVRLWRKAEKIARQMGMEYELARAQIELVRHDRGGADRDRLLADAAQTFERLGAMRLLELARTL